MSAVMLKDEISCKKGCLRQSEMPFFSGSAHFCRLHGFNFVKKESIIKSKIFHRFYKFDYLIATNGTLNNIASYIFNFVFPGFFILIASIDLSCFCKKT